MASIIPVVILLFFVGGFAWVGYQMYLYTQTLAERGQKSMAKRNISFTKDGGMKVGVKEVSTEKYSDTTQQWLVKAWNLSSWPAYKSMFWNKEAGAEQPTGSSSGVKASATASPNPRPQAIHSYTR